MKGERQIIRDHHPDSKKEGEPPFSSTAARSGPGGKGRETWYPRGKRKRGAMGTLGSAKKWEQIKEARPISPITGE